MELTEQNELYVYKPVPLVIIRKGEDFAEVEKKIVRCSFGLVSQYGKESYLAAFNGLKVAKFAKVGKRYIFVTAGHTSGIVEGLADNLTDRELWEPEAKEETAIAANDWASRADYAERYMLSFYGIKTKVRYANGIYYVKGDLTATQRAYIFAALGFNTVFEPLDDENTPLG